MTCTIFKQTKKQKQMSKGRKHNILLRVGFTVKVPLIKVSICLMNILRI